MPQRCVACRKGRDRARKAGQAAKASAAARVAGMPAGRSVVECLDGGDLVGARRLLARALAVAIDGGVGVRDLPLVSRELRSVMAELDVAPAGTKPKVDELAEHRARHGRAAG